MTITHTSKRLLKSPKVLLLVLSFALVYIGIRIGASWQTMSPELKDGLINNDYSSFSTENLKSFSNFCGLGDQTVPPVEKCFSNKGFAFCHTDKICLELIPGANGEFLAPGTFIRPASKIMSADSIGSIENIRMKDKFIPDEQFDKLWETSDMHMEGTSGIIFPFNDGYHPTHCVERLMPFFTIFQSGALGIDKMQNLYVASSGFHYYASNFTALMYGADVKVIVGKMNFNTIMTARKTGTARFPKKPTDPIILCFDRAIIPAAKHFPVDTGLICDPAEGALFRRHVSSVLPEYQPHLGNTAIIIDRNTNRKIKNIFAAHARVTYLLHKFNMDVRTVPEMGELSFTEQIKTMASASIIISVHASHLVNLLFSPPGAVLIEIYPFMFVDPCFRMLARSVGVHHLSWIVQAYYETSIEQWNEKVECFSHDYPFDASVKPCKTFYAAQDQILNLIQLDTYVRIAYETLMVSNLTSL